MALIRSPFLPLVFLAIGTALIVCTYQSAGVLPSRGADLIIGTSWMLFLLVWMDADAQRRSGRPCYDFGFLCALVFPLSLLWYCIWSRGWKWGPCPAWPVSGWLPGSPPQSTGRCCNSPDRRDHFFPCARCRAKNSCRIARHSSRSTPPMTTAWWFSRTSLVIWYRLWTAPALGSVVP